MVSIRAQSVAAVSRQNSSQGENLNPIPEGDQTSPQDLLPQNFSSITSLIRQQHIKSIFDQTEDIMSITSVLIKAKKIVSLNESVD
jgi:hypothetical protein